MRSLPLYLAWALLQNTAPFDGRATALQLKSLAKLPF
jgi:hypothetical protein